MLLYDVPLHCHAGIVLGVRSQVGGRSRAISKNNLSMEYIELYRLWLSRNRELTKQRANMHKFLEIIATHTERPRDSLFSRDRGISHTTLSLRPNVLPLAAVVASAALQPGCHQCSRRAAAVGAASALVAAPNLAQAGERKSKPWRSPTGRATGDQGRLAST